MSGPKRRLFNGHSPDSATQIRLSQRRDARLTSQNFLSNIDPFFLHIISVLMRLLKTNRLATLPEDLYSKNFQFIASGRIFKSSFVVADFLSPRVAKIHELDRSADSFELDTRDCSQEFEEFFGLANGSELAVSSENYRTLLSIADELENSEVLSFLMEMAREQLTVHSALALFEMKSRAGMNCERELDFLAVNFEDYWESELPQLPVQILYQIFAHSAFKVSNEDFLYACISRLVKVNLDYLPLLEFVHFQYLSEASISSFVEDSCEFLNSMNLPLWRRVCCRLATREREGDQAPNRNAIRLFIHSLAFPVMTLDVSQTMSVTTLKHEILKRTAIPVSNQELRFENTILPDGHISLAEHGIGSGSSLQLIVISSSLLTVSVRTDFGRNFAFEVHESISIEEFKRMIEPRTKYPANRCSILYNGRPVPDDLRFCDVGIRRNAELDLRVERESRFSVMVYGIGRTFQVDVVPTMDVAELRTRIAAKTGIPADSLAVVFSGRPLCDGTIADFGIISGSTIICSIRAKSNFQENYELDPWDP
jgi:hypothetical protein